MRRKAYGFKVAGQTNQGSARLAILGREFVTTKRLVNRDVDYSRGKADKAAMVAALVGCNVEITKGEYVAPRAVLSKKATALPMNYFKGTGFGG